MQYLDRWQDRKDNAPIKAIAQIQSDRGKYAPGTITQSLNVCVYIDGDKGQFTPSKWPWYSEVTLLTWNAERMGSSIEFISLFGPFDSYKEALDAARNFRDGWIINRAKGLTKEHQIYVGGYSRIRGQLE